MIHRSKLAAFEISETIDDHNPQSTYEYLTKMIRSMNSQMEKILNNKKFYKDLIEELHSDIAKIQLPYLHFLPDVSKVKSFFSFFKDFYFLHYFVFIQLEK
jgi:hypothetical protein